MLLKCEVNVENNASEDNGMKEREKKESKRRDLFKRENERMKKSERT